MKERTRLWVMFVVTVLATLFAGAPCPAWAQDDQGPTASLSIVVVRESNGKPVKDAKVVLHPVNRKGKATRGEMDLKTEADGHTRVDGVPYGSVEVQVLAPGFQTFGQDYEVKQAEMEITVKLKRPAGQYSIYEQHDDKKDQKPQ